MRTGKPTGRMTQAVPWDPINPLDQPYRKVFNLDNPPN
ncbi:unnamed protein product, partial [Allacma fusca]